MKLSQWNIWQRSAATLVLTAMAGSLQQAHATNTYEPQIQAFYVSAFGRPADPAGLEFFQKKLEEGADPKALEAAFLALQAEYAGGRALPEPQQLWSQIKVNIDVPPPDATAQGDAQQPANTPLTPAQLQKIANQLPGLRSTIPGMSRLQELQSSLQQAGGSDSLQPGTTQGGSGAGGMGTGADTGTPAEDPVDRSQLGLNQLMNTPGFLHTQNPVETQHPVELPY